MSRKLIIFAATIFMASVSSIAGAMELRVITVEPGAWAIVTIAGEPAPGVVITTDETYKGRYITNSNGHAYIPVYNSRPSRSITFTATNAKGETVSVKRYMSQHKRRSKDRCYKKNMNIAC